MFPWQTNKTDRTPAGILRRGLPHKPKVRRNRNLERTEPLAGNNLLMIALALAVQSAIAGLNRFAMTLAASP
jgi:hypothetical protein